MLGERIKYCRKQNNYTQEELSKLLRTKYGLGTDRAMISKWETGFQEPQVHTIACLADLFGVSIDFLNGDDNMNFKSIDVEDKEVFKYIKLTKSQQELFDTIKNLDDDKIRLAIRILHSILDESGQ